MKTRMNIEATPLSPSVLFDIESNTLEINGRAIPMNPDRFWRPVLNWLIQNNLHLNDLNISLTFDYLNSGSQKFLVKMLNLVRETAEKGMTPERKIVWNYQDFDEDMFEIGHDLEFVSGLSFEYNRLEDQFLDAA
jgi:hypothetical protein